MLSAYGPHSPQAARPITQLQAWQLFLDTDEQTMTVTIDVLDGNGESISHKVVNNVPLQRNRITTLTGSIYSAGAGTDFTVNTNWLSETEMPF